MKKGKIVKKDWEIRLEKKIKELTEIMGKVNWNKLEELLSNKVNTSIKFDQTVQNGFHSHIAIKSQELINFAGVMIPAFSSVTIQGLVMPCLDNTDLLRANIKYCWTHPKAGDNAYTFMDVVYSLTKGEWTIE